MGVKGNALRHVHAHLRRRFKSYSKAGASGGAGQGCCPVTSSSAIRDVIRVAARCDQADDLSEGLESARSTARSPEGIETRIHAASHYGSCDACDGPGVELRGRPRVGLGVALSLVCGPWTPTRGKPERRRGPPCFGAEPERGAEPLALSRRLVLSFVGRRARCGGWVGACRARAPTAVSGLSWFRGCYRFVTVIR